MAILPIITIPDPVLRKEAVEQVEMGNAAAVDSAAGVLDFMKVELARDA